LLPPDLFLLDVFRPLLLLFCIINAKINILDERRIMGVEKRRRPDGFLAEKHYLRSVVSIIL